MELFLQILEVILMILGSATAMVLLVIGIDNLTYKIKKIMERQCKIRCLCKHEYIIDAKWLCWGFIEHVFKCRKCGKVLRINVFENKVGDEHEV